MVQKPVAGAKAKVALRWVAGAAPVLPFLLVLYVFHLPADVRAQTLVLVGDWKVKAGDNPLGASSELDDSLWGTVRLPGSFARQGVEGKEAWLRRWVDLPAERVKEELFLTVGDTRSGFVRAYVNGHPVGDQAVAEAQFKIHLHDWNGWTVPREYLTPGKNLIALHFTWLVPQYDGTTDQRLFLGPRATLKPFFLKATTVENVLNLGQPFLFLFVLVALTAFVVTEWRSPLRRLYLSTTGLVATTTVYLALRGGLGTPLLFDIPTRVKLVPCILLMAFGFSLEFYDEWYFRRVTRVGKINRICTGICAAVMLAVPLGPTLFNLYRVLIPFMLVSVTCSAIINVLGLVRRSPHFSPLLLSQSVCFMFGVVLDLLTDLRVFNVARVTPLTVSSVGMAASLVVLGDFFRISGESKGLAASLRVTNEELAEALVAAKESARLKGEFLATVSHELRTPLNSIINIPRGLLADFLTPPWAQCASCSAEFHLEPDESVTDATACPTCSRVGTLQVRTQPEYKGVAANTLEHLRMVQRSGNHLLSVVNQILDASKLEAGKETLTLEELPLSAVLDSAYAAVHPIALPRGIALAFPEPRPGFLVKLDAVKVAQILINLLSNAVRFSPDQSPVELEVVDEGASFVAKVRDRGIGIAPEHHRLIFESFRQAEGGSTRKFGGTGLGLAIAQQLVQLHGGSIWLESAPGSGSTFFVRLPKRAEEIQVPTLDSGEKSVILVVDDEPVGIETLRLALRPVGHHLVGVTDPRKALAAIEELSPSLLILDVMMPRKSGITLLQEIRESPKLSSLPVLVLSAYDGNREIVTALGASWMSKPWDAPSLLLEIDRLTHPAPPR